MAKAKNWGSLHRKYTQHMTVLANRKRTALLAKGGQILILQRLDQVLEVMPTFVALPLFEIRSRATL